MEKLYLCRCGCGKSVKKKENKYIKGHYWKGRKRGKHTFEHNRKISHGVILAYKKEEIKLKHLKNTPRGKNHSCYGTEGYWKGKHHTEESKQKSRNSQLGPKHHFYNKKHKKTTKQKTSTSCKEWWNTKDGIKQREIQKNKMDNGQAAYCNKFIKNPSKPQLELFELVKQIFNNVLLNYSFFNYSLDIAIPNIRLVIEYDGSYWHKNEEYDIKRQKYLERHKWKFIKYIDYVPELEILKNDIEQKLSEMEMK